MRSICLSFLVLMSVASATTLDVLQVFQPISLHGTDVDHEFEGEHIQARIFPRPMVLSGAMPESLVSAIGSPHRMPATTNYEIKESNLLALYQVGISGDFEEDLLVVSFDLSKMKAPEGVELPIRKVLKLAIAALKQTLADYHHAENDPLKVRVEVTGTKEGNASLKDLASNFVVSE